MSQTHNSFISSMWMLHLLAHSQASKKSFAREAQSLPQLPGSKPFQAAKAQKGIIVVCSSNSQTSPQRAEASSCSQANDSTERVARCSGLQGGHLHSQPRWCPLHGILWTTSRLVSSAWYLVEPATHSQNFLARFPTGLSSFFFFLDWIAFLFIYFYIFNIFIRV